MNGRLDTPGTITPADGDGGAWAAGGSGAEPPPFAQLPAPPPPPPRSKQAIKQDVKRDKQQLRSTTLQDFKRHARRPWKGWYWVAGGLAAAIIVPWWTQTTTRGIINAAAPTGTSTPAQVVQKPSMPNPLEKVKLSPQAAVMLGAYDADRNGELDSFNASNSAMVLTELLKSIDLCSWFINVVPAVQTGQYALEVSRTFKVGAAQLAECPAPAPTTTVPATTVAPATTAAPTTTAAPAK